MMLALKIVGGVFVVLLFLAAALRVRKLRRDEMREIASQVDRRLITPPPSPYQPSQGFRVVQGDEPPRPAVRREPPRPRLEPTREYVFSESQIPSTYVESISPRGRHDAEWALSKAGRPARSGGLVVGAVVAVIVVIVVVGYFYEHRHRPHQPTAATTTTAVAVRWPGHLVATATSAGVATYDLPVASYRVTVTGAAGSVHAVFESGSTNAVRWQGTVATTSSETRTLSGASRVVLDSATNAAVSVDGHPVVLPTPRTGTLTLQFVAEG